MMLTLSNHVGEADVLKKNDIFTIQKKKICFSIYPNICSFSEKFYGFIRTDLADFLLLFSYQFIMSFFPNVFFSVTAF